MTEELTPYRPNNEMAPSGPEALPGRRPRDCRPGSIFNVEAQRGAMAEIEMGRAMAEVQAAVVMAKRFPRNVQDAVEKIMISCQRPGLAEAAVYTYARGGSNITGPSIRLAEAIAQCWGNLQFGVRELEQRAGESTVEAFCLDLETNTRQVKVFQVKHIRPTKKGSYAIDDPRDVYELVANQGARRLRACILGIIPGDIVDDAVAECERTMTAKADTGPEGIKKLVGAFAKVGVAKEQIEKRIQRRLDTITPAQMVSLRKVFNSLRDGMSTAADWFEVAAAYEDAPKTGTEAAKEALMGKKGKDTKPPSQPPPQEAVDQETGEVKTTRDKAEMLTCSRDGEERSIGWCSDSCVTAIDCTDWR